MRNASGLNGFFDGHNDLLAQLWLNSDADPVGKFLEGGLPGHLDLPRCLRAEWLGGLCAIFVPPLSYLRQTRNHRLQQLEDPDADVYSGADVRRIVMQQAEIFHELAARSTGRIRHCLSTDDIREALEQGQRALVLHLEGAEAIDAEFRVLDKLCSQHGLRSIGPMWNHSNQWGQGLQDYPAQQPEQAAGLTEAGKALIRRCRQKQLLVDCSHMTPAVFNDYAALGGILVATHSNCFDISPHRRNLYADALRTIAASKGLVGATFVNAFLRPDQQEDDSTPLALILDHLERLLETLGPDSVALGSDFDGALIPAALGDVCGLPLLRESMRRRGWDEPLIRQLCHENWLAALTRIWHPAEPCHTRSHIETAQQSDRQS